MKLIETINCFISGDWGSEFPTEDTVVKVHCLRSADIVPIYQYDYDNIPFRYISKYSYEKRELKEGDIVIEKSGGTNNCSTGRPIYISKELIEKNYPLICSNFCTAIRVKDGWSSLYVYYFLQLVHKNNIFFHFEGKTSGIHNLDIDMAFKTINIHKIPYNTQIKMASSIREIEQKIYINNCINKKLDNISKLLYDYWFMQYDFPDENGRPYKSSGGAMVYNEKLKREIPKGWDYARLIDIANITMGQSPEGSSYNENGDGIIFYQGSTDFGIRFPKVRMFTTAPSRYAKKGDILMSVRAPVGATNIASNDCCIGRGLSSINSKIGSITYIYEIIFYFKSMFEQKNSAGTTFGSITKDELYGLPCVKPNQKVIDAFEKICSPIFEKQMKIGEETEKLKSFKDFLLPLLITGQVHIN